MSYIARILFLISNALTKITNMLLGQPHKLTSELTNKHDIMGPVIDRKWLKDVRAKIFYSIDFF